MNWRLATILNVAVALVTIITVVFGVSRVRQREALLKAAAAELAHAKRNQLSRSRATGMDDVTQVRVEHLASVPPSELYEVFLRAKPEEIVALALKFNDLPNDGPTIGAIGVFFQAWAELDGRSALETAFRIKDVTLKGIAAGTVVGSVSPSNAAELAIRLHEHPDKDLVSECNGRYLDMLLERWAYIDPPAAAKFLDNITDPKNSLFYTTGGKISRAWATVDPYAALAWVDQPRESGTRDIESLFNEVVAGWSSRDLTAAAAYMAAHLNHPGSPEAASTIAIEMLNQDPKKATNWLNDLQPGEAKTTAERTVGYGWAQKDPSAAAHWVEKLPRPDQKIAVDAVAIVWSANNWPEAAKWLGGLSGDLRDDAIAAALTRNATYIPPAESLPLALSLNDRRSRTEIIQGVIVQWAQTEPQAAAAWVKASSLSKEEKQELLSPDLFSREPAPQ